MSIPVAASRITVRDPATGDVVGEAPDVSVTDVGPAMARAAEGFARWRIAPPRVRADALHRAYALLVERQEELARTLTSEMGKPFAEAREEVLYAAGFLREYAECATRLGGRTASREDGRGHFTTHEEPVGVVAVVTPWNFPLAMGARKVAPALAAGCSVVIKPSDLTPLSMLAFAAILEDAGVPSEVLSVLSTTDSPGVVAAMLDHPATAKLSFTGSTTVGRALACHAGTRLLRTSLELGGNAPFIVFDDADLDAAVEGAMLAKFRNGGQSCVAADRIYLHESIADAFTERLAGRAASLVAGHGLDPSTTLGPMITASAAARIHAVVADAQRSGARLVFRGSAPPGETFVPATVLADVPADARAMTHETFGPVAAISSFVDEDEVVAAANDTPYGLAAYLYTRDAGRLSRVGRALEVGMVGLNTGAISDPAAPFGGTKASGYGREGGHEGLTEYLQLRYLASPAAAG